VPELGDRAIRELFVYRSYRMLYQVQDAKNQIRIVAFIHAARDLDAILSD